MTFPSKKTRTATSEASHKPSPDLLPTLESTIITSLSDDLLLSCLARVSRLYYPNLSLVSKRFSSLLTSTELYQTRSLLGRTESCLYVCLKFSPDSNPRCFTLCQRPNQTLTNDDSEYALAPISNPNFTQVPWGTVVAIGYNIYNIGSNKSPLSSISILDCRTHTWSEGPSMQVERYWSVANVFDGHIYVAGGCGDIGSSNWMEVFDPKAQAWEFLWSPVVERCKSKICRSAVIEGKIYMLGHMHDQGLAYNPKEDIWEVIREESNLDLGWEWLSYCVIDNVLYSYSNSYGIVWYDIKSREWENLMGLKGLPKFDMYGLVKLVDYGGKMAVLWDKYVPSSGNNTIWCAVIVLERRNGKEIWGMVEWLDGVLEVPKSFAFVSALSATV